MAATVDGGGAGDVVVAVLLLLLMLLVWGGEKRGGLNIGTRADEHSGKCLRVCVCGPVNAFFYVYACLCGARLHELVATQTHTQKKRDRDASTRADIMAGWGANVSGTHRASPNRWPLCWPRCRATR